MWKTQNDNSPFKDWKNYQNKNFPIEKVIAIGEDLERDSLQGFSEVGTLIKRLQTNPSEIKRYLPLYTGTQPITLGLTEVPGLASISGQTNYEPILIEVMDLTNGKNKKIELPRVTTIPEVAVKLDNNLAAAPDVAKKLLIVKEFAHLLYMQQHREFLKNAINRRYRIDENVFPNWETHLQLAGTQGVHPPDVDLGEEYYSAVMDLDVTGHFHTLPAFGQMKDAKLLSQHDLKVLDVNDRMFEAAKKSGFLSKMGGAYVWREGIGPLSSEWRNLARPIWKGYPSSS